MNNHRVIQRREESTALNILTFSGFFFFAQVSPRTYCYFSVHLLRIKNYITFFIFSSFSTISHAARTTSSPVKKINNLLFAKLRYKLHSSGVLCIVPQHCNFTITFSDFKRTMDICVHI